MTSEHNAAEADDIEELLPWYAAGTLSSRDAERVKTALARDPELARRFELAREELGATIHLNETLGAPSARAIQDLFAKIDAEPRRQRASLGLGTRIAEFLGGLTPRTLAYASVAAVIAIVVQAGLIGVMVNKSGTHSFETASAPTTAPGVGAFTIIRFAPQATMDDINKFLELNHFNVVAGPTGGGLYKVRVAENPLPSGDLGALMQKLQKDKVVGFVAPTR
ncbi:MAG: anti-sigma factor family protein [Thiohalocapsa sp.]|jgi:anti-sigma factor RsiW